MCMLLAFSWFFQFILLFFFFFFKQKTAYEMQRGLVGSEMCIRDRSTWGCTNNVQFVNTLCGCTYCKECIEDTMRCAIEEEEYSLSDVLCNCGKNIDFQVLMDINKELADKLNNQSCSLGFECCSDNPDIPSCHENCPPFCRACLEHKIEDSQLRLPTQPILCYCGLHLHDDVYKLLGKEYAEKYVKTIEQPM
eukprot:TRINITY_DN5084_c0_g1_i1.p2 TRINITY_DN5084_c0_g1~~TRINITY_DN5084_c0_g1_i1.p2  ORF type:complete len:210 (-),score=37.65 TRINITY_DN5084_c0_g1_i1:24-602(-)